MEKERRVKALAIVVLVIAVLGLTIAFAALSQTLTINGSAKLDASKWGIKFENLSSPATTGNASVTGEAKIKIDDNTVIENMNVKLTTPGDKVVYTVDLVNEGSINAKIDKIVKTTTPNYILFNVYKGNTGNDELNEGYVLGKESSIPLRIEIEFDKEKITKEDLPTEASTIELSYGLTFVQTDEDATSIGQAPTTACITFDKKDTYSVGDEIALCNNDTGKSEDFYVISDNGDTVTALAKYNLLVGNTEVWNDDFSSIISLTPISSSEEEYGLQNELAAGYDWDTKKGTPTTNTLIGVINFANPDESRKISSCSNDYGCHYGYWTDTSGNLLSKYGSSYPANVFDDNSNLWGPVQNYKSYLESLGYTNVSVTLPSYDDMIGLGCSRWGYYCNDAPSWVYSTNYWIGYANDYRYIWHIKKNYQFALRYFYNDPILGLRPVITISKTDL